MEEKAAIYLESFAVRSQLAALGLLEEVLLAAVSAGEAAAAMTTLHHPKNHAGFVMWSEPSKTLRDLLVPFGWVKEDVDGQPLVRNARDTIAITVAGGDEWTGRPPEREEQPRTRSKKGPVTINAVKANSGWLFRDMAIDELKRLARPKRKTFVLLTYRDEENAETRSELSLPVETDDADHICGWKMRILLPAIPWGDEPTRISQTKPEDGGLSSVDDVQIRRKA
jgi:hypothetical protein